MIHHPVLKQLERELTRCTTPRRQSAILRRWANEPALAGLGIDDIVAICAVPTTSQNPVVAALLDLHQKGDTDAGTVLMNVTIPMLNRVAHRVTGGQRAVAELDHLFAALGHVLATIDPAKTPLGSDGQPKPLIAHIGQRLCTSRDTLGRNERTRRRHEAAGRNLTARLDSDEATKHVSTRRSAVEDAALASIELDQIVTVVRTGQLPKASWNYLLDCRITPTPGHTLASAQRSGAYRAATKLSELVGHAA